jgi:hypothetical protein
MKTLTLVMIFCLMTAAAFGQTNPKLKELEPFVGTWQCIGTAFASPFGPEHPTKATVTGAWILGGAWLEIHYAEAKTAKNPHPYDVRGFYGYDEQPKALVDRFDRQHGQLRHQPVAWVAGRQACIHRTDARRRHNDDRTRHLHKSRQERDAPRVRNGRQGQVDEARSGNLQTLT